MVSKTTNVKAILVCIMSFFVANTIGQNVTLKYVDATITIDGIFDEPIWDQLPEITGFFNYLPTDIGLAQNQTSVKIFHNGEFLFVSATYFDTTPKMQVSTLKRDVSIASSDAFIMILDTQNQEQNGYFFALNSLGNQTDGLVGRDNGGYNLSFSWNTVWKSEVVLNGNKKQYEFAIPLKALNFNKENTVFGIQFYVRDIKNNSWTILKNVKRNYANLDLRFTEKFEIENLPDRSVSRFTFIPSLTVNYQNDIDNNLEETTIKPSLDVQYNLTSSLKLDATINPDFSQIDVDQQVTNLTRFSIFFPERRIFFLESSDLFSDLGTDDINPFYSRRIGANSDIQFGVKLSGNIAQRTRLGVLNVQTEAEDEVQSQNFGAFVLEQQLSKNFSTTGFLINRQQTDKLDFIDEYNRVMGINLNYKSDDNKWIGQANFGKSFSDSISTQNGFYNAEINYNQRGVFWKAALKNIGRNYITDVGFTPRLYNYDAVNDIVIREGYTQSIVGLELVRFPETNKTINRYRYVNFSNNTYWDDEGKLTQSSFFYNTALFFKDLSAIYANLYFDHVNLKYTFDPLNNGNAILPDTYNYFRARVGYNSVGNRKLVFRTYAQHGQYFNGNISSTFVTFDYRLLPFANLQASYEINAIDLEELGSDTFYLARLTGEIFFNNRLNWTTYIQYNTQLDNFNINSRLQWEYKPLSYVYLVITDNYSQDITRKNWGAALKINYRLEL